MPPTHTDAHGRTPCTTRSSVDSNPPTSARLRSCLRVELNQRSSPNGTAKGVDMRDGEFTREEVAAHYGVAVRTVDRWIREGRIPAFKVGGSRVTIRSDDIDAAVVPMPVHAREVTT